MTDPLVNGTSFLASPGSAGAVGALLDEYARAAEDFCRVVEGFDADAFTAERPDDDADCVSARTICRHVCRAARGYASDLRGAQGLPADRPRRDFKDAVRSPTDVRPHLAAELRYTEAVIEPLRHMTGPEVLAMTFQVSWGSTYDPEQMLEHAIVHLLRHRRQLERW